MPSKQNPGVFDCYKAALPDEPIFVILGRDLAGPATLERWALERTKLGLTASQDDRDRIAAALDEAKEMQEWRERNVEMSIDGVPPWKLPRQVLDEMEPIFQRPDQTFKFDGCERSYTMTEIAEILRESERPDPPVAEVIVQGLVNVAGIPISVEELTSEMRRLWDYDKKHGRPHERKIGKSPALAAPYQPGGFDMDRDPYVAAAEGFTDNQTRGERVVIDTKPDDLAHAPEVAPHRFSFFHKGERYAYAKGLEINPTHLPVALDAMALDGWHLCAIFGETDSKNIGFVFERRPDPVWLPSGLDIAHGWGLDSPKPQPRHIPTEPLDVGPLPDLDESRGIQPGEYGRQLDC